MDSSIRSIPPVAGGIVLCLLPALAMLPPAAGAATFAVNAPQDGVDANPGDGVCQTAGGLCTLRAAVQEANATPSAPHSINLPAGNYTLTLAGAGEDFAATGDLDVRRDLTIFGSPLVGLPSVVDGGGLDRVFQVHQGASLVTLRYLTISGGNAGAGRGGGIQIGQATLDLVGCTLVGNSAQSGGALAYDEAINPNQIVNSILSGNDADQGGAIFLDADGSASQPSLSIQGSTVDANTATDLGGAIHLDRGYLAIADSQISSNNAFFSGGAVSVPDHASPSGSSLAIANSLLVDNGVTFFHGGALFVENPLATVTLTGTDLVDNSAPNFNGGAIYNAGRLILDSSTISGSQAVLGGGVYSLGTLEATETTISGNDAERGGGIYSLGDVSYAGGTINLNGAADAGAGLYVESAALVVQSTILAGNQVADASGCGCTVVGSAIHVAGSPNVQIHGSTIAGNLIAFSTPAPIAVAGAAVAVSASPLGMDVDQLLGNEESGLALEEVTGVVTRSTFADHAEAGIIWYALSALDLDVTNCTLSQNDYGLRAFGPTSPAGPGSSLTLRHDSMMNNGQYDLFDLGNSNTQVIVERSILGAGCSGPGAVFLSLGYNIDVTGVCSFNSPGDLVADPLLEPLAPNGGLTLTHLPLAASPAIDAIPIEICPPPPTDQRGTGFDRPQDGNGDLVSACDIGSVEVCEGCSGQIFADGFESGDTSAWSAVQG